MYRTTLRVPVLSAVLFLSVAVTPPLGAQITLTDLVYVTGGTGHSEEIRKMTTAGVSTSILKTCPVSWPTSWPTGNLKDGRGCFLFDPVVAPGGQLIAFRAGYVAGEMHCYNSLWVVRANGSNPRQLVFGCDILNMAWAPDGQTILYHRYGKGWFLANPCTAKLPINDRNATSINLGANATYASFSRDGQWIVFQVGKQIRKIRPNGTGNTLVGSPGTFPRWTKPGTLVTPTTDPNAYDRIIFISDRDGAGDVYTMNANGADQRRITTTNGKKESADFNTVQAMMVYVDRKTPTPNIMLRTTGEPRLLGTGVAPAFGDLPRGIQACPN